MGPRELPRSMMAPHLLSLPTSPLRDWKQHLVDPLACWQQPLCPVMCRLPYFRQHSVVKFLSEKRLDPCGAWDAPGPTIRCAHSGTTLALGPVFARQWSHCLIIVVCFWLPLSQFGLYGFYVEVHEASTFGYNWNCSQARVRIQCRRDRVYFSELPYWVWRICPSNTRVWQVPVACHSFAVIDC